MRSPAPPSNARRARATPSPAGVPSTADRPGAAGRLFAYGTLMRGFPLHGLLDGAAEYVGEGWARGRLVDLGAYPGAVPDPHAEIAGELYRVHRPSLWRRLDSAEGPQYDRRGVTVRIADGRELAAFIYWYRGPLDRGVPIPGGDWRGHLPARSVDRSSRLGGH